MPESGKSPTASTPAKGFAERPLTKWPRAIGRSIRDGVRKVVRFLGKHVKSNRTLILRWTAFDLLLTACFMAAHIQLPNVVRVGGSFFQSWFVIILISAKFPLTCIGIYSAYMRKAKGCRHYLRSLWLQMTISILILFALGKLQCQCKGIVAQGIEAGGYYQCEAVRDFSTLTGETFVNFFPKDNWHPKGHQIQLLRDRVVQLHRRTQNEKMDTNLRDLGASWEDRVALDPGQIEDGDLNESQEQAIREAFSIMDPDDDQKVPMQEAIAKIKVLFQDVRGHKRSNVEKVVHEVAGTSESQLDQHQVRSIMKILILRQVSYKSAKEEVKANNTTKESSLLAMQPRVRPRILRVYRGRYTSLGARSFVAAKPDDKKGVAEIHTAPQYRDYYSFDKIVGETHAICLANPCVTSEGLVVDGNGQEIPIREGLGGSCKRWSGKGKPWCFVKEDAACQAVPEDRDEDLKERKLEFKRRGKKIVPSTARCALEDPGEEILRDKSKADCWNFKTMAIFIVIGAMLGNLWAMIVVAKFVKQTCSDELTQIEAEFDISDEEDSEDLWKSTEDELDIDDTSPSKEASDVEDKGKSSKEKQAPSKAALDATTEKKSKKKSKKSKKASTKESDDFEVDDQSEDDGEIEDDLSVISSELSDIESDEDPKDKKGKKK